MGISAGGKRGAVKSDINVTPLVDIVLVLLIVFLVTTPIMMRQITIEVPRKAEHQEITTKKQISILVKATGMVEFDDGTEKKEFPRVQLAQALRDVMRGSVTEKAVFMDFDDKLPYHEVVEAMDTAKGVMGKDDSTVALKMREEKGQKPGGDEGGDSGEAPPGE
jgi:biopolymer transport protein ExbD